MGLFCQNTALNSDISMLLQKQRSLTKTQVQLPPINKESPSFLLGGLAVICCHTRNYSIPDPITV